MQRATVDFALFFRRIADRLVALSGCYVDDVLQATPPEFKEEIRRQIKKRFDLAFTDLEQFVYTGILCDTSNPNLRKMSQSQYTKRLQYLPTDASFHQFRSVRAKIMWAVHTRPDIAFAASLASQTTESTFTSDSVKTLNRVIKHLKQTSQVSLLYPKLDQNSLRMVVYTDSPYNNLPGSRSQLGFIICLTDKTKRCCVLHFASHKSHRVARSSMAAETLAFVDGFDNAFLIKHDLQRILGRDIPLLMLTDNKLLFDALTRSRYTTERRLMVDIASAREAYVEGIISNVGLIKTDYNPADSLTNINGNRALAELLRTHTIDHPVEQFVIRRGTTSTGSQASKKGK